MASNLHFLGTIGEEQKLALLRAILSVLCDADLRARLIAGGRRSLAERFDPQALAEQVVAVYRSVQ